MKFYQFFTFTVLAAISAALLIIGMATLHWVTTDTNSNIPGFGTQTHSGLRRWYTEDSNGNSQSSNSWNNDCNNAYAQCRFYTAGSWGLGWGIAALALETLAVLIVAAISCVTLFHGVRGKYTAALLMFLAFGCVLVGALTYWSHLPTLSGTNSDLSWSYILYCIGGGVALLTSIILCMLPTKHYYANTTVVTAPPTVISNTTTTTTTTYPDGTTATYPGAPAVAPTTPKYPSYGQHTNEMPAYPANHVNVHGQPTEVVVQ